MRTATTALLSLLAVSGLGAQEEGVLDRLGKNLAFASDDGWARGRLAGTLDLENYFFAQPAPGLLSSDGHHLFNPRLSLFLDAQVGSQLYFFAQARIDRGFDPGDHPLEARLDEYAVRYTPGTTGWVSLQVGKFATVAGNWVKRHDSWSNPFITAPLPYENVTAIFDVSAANSSALLLKWANLGPGPFFPEEYPSARRIPILWGPSYASGAAASGTLGRFDYAFEIKNAALSSRPTEWDAAQVQWQHPTYTGRIGYRPDAAWNFGLSASSGSYLKDSARPTLMRGTGLNEYREVVVAQDISYAWHHFQLWAEFFETRFENPRLGPAETFAYYVEARYKFTPQFSGAVRWNQQLYGTVRGDNGTPVRWGRDTWRVDVAPAYRFTPHCQVKLQYSFQHHPLGQRSSEHLLVTQFVLRF